MVQGVYYGISNRLPSPLSILPKIFSDPSGVVAGCQIQNVTSLEMIFLFFIFLAIFGLLYATLNLGKRGKSLPPG